MRKRFYSVIERPESILGQTAIDVVGQSLLDVLPEYVPDLPQYLDQVIHQDESIVGLETNPNLAERGKMQLRFNFSPLKNDQKITQGVAIVMEDLTEKKHLEAQRRLFEKMVSPAVINLLNPDSLQLGGQRSEITVIFADIRGFTGFSEGVSPEELVSILNRYLAAGAEAILAENGTIDKFLGDAIMAWFNAPIPQADHTLRAVRAAIGIREALEKLHKEIPARNRLSFGVGIHVGEAVLGLIGTEKRLDYTAIGDCVNTAKRIQENSGPGQILISQSAYDRVKNTVNASSFEAIRAKGKKDLIEVWELLDLK